MNADKKKCSKCGRLLPIDRFGKRKSWCKSCLNLHTSHKRGYVSEESLVKIERVYKESISTRILDIRQTTVNLICPDEYFVRLINYKNAWVSNYGRVLERYNEKYVVKRTKENIAGEKICTLQKNIYNGNKWIWQKLAIEVWQLVVSTFIVNYDIVGNTHCWHKNNNKADNYYKNIYPVNEKQYNALLEAYSSDLEVSEDMVLDIVNNIAYKSDDWNANKWKRTRYGIGYIGCDDASATEENRDIYIKWTNMIQRCYDENTHKMKPYYAPCSVDIEWLNFSNYREWHRENAIGNQKVDLDKDLLIPGNTVYSSEKCTLISHFMNTLFETRGIENDIVKKSDTGKYEVTMSVLGKRESIGTLDTAEEGKQELIQYKEKYIRAIAKKSRYKVPDKAYQAMLNWKFDI